MVLLKIYPEGFYENANANLRPLFAVEINISICSGGALWDYGAGYQGMTLSDDGSELAEYVESEFRINESVLAQRINQNNTLLFPRLKQP